MAKKKKSGRLVSRLAYQEFVSYDGAMLAVPAYAQNVKIADVSRCGKLPAGIQCVEDK